MRSGGLGMRFDFQPETAAVDGHFDLRVFRLNRSMRQCTFVALIIGRMPDCKDFENGKFDQYILAGRAGYKLALTA